jgi:hypothetical protein
VLGLWDSWYEDVTEPATYGDEHSYRLAAEWLAPCATVADWGCGTGGFRGFVYPDQDYVGFDGSATPFADEIVDLAAFRFETEGVLLRHVLEHNLRWRNVLTNAAASFTSRLALVLFTPLLDTAEPERVLDWLLMRPPDGWVPDLSLSRQTILDIVGIDSYVGMHAFASETAYGAETVICFERTGT